MEGVRLALWLALMVTLTGSRFVDASKQSVVKIIIKRSPQDGARNSGTGNAELVVSRGNVISSGFGIRRPVPPDNSEAFSGDGDIAKRQRPRPSIRTPYPRRTNPARRRDRLLKTTPNGGIDPKISSPHVGIFVIMAFVILALIAGISYLGYRFCRQRGVNKELSKADSVHRSASPG